MVSETIAAAAPDMRSARRSNLFLAATIRADERTSAVRIRDLSPRGAQLEGADLPKAGAQATIIRGQLRAEGKIVWSRQRRCGVRFDECLALAGWLDGTANHEQRRVDEIVTGIQAGRPPSPSSEDPEGFNARDLQPRIAEELAFVARMLDSLGEILVSEPAVAMRHSSELQNLDISRQILAHLATLLVAEAPERAIQAIGMESLRRRLQRQALPEPVHHIGKA